MLICKSCKIRDDLKKWVTTRNFSMTTSPSPSNGRHEEAIVKPSTMIEKNNKNIWHSRFSKKHGRSVFFSFFLVFDVVYDSRCFTEHVARKMNVSKAFWVQVASGDPFKICYGKSLPAGFFHYNVRHKSNPDAFIAILRHKSPGFFHYNFRHKSNLDVFITILGTSRICFCN